MILKIKGRIVPTVVNSTVNRTVTADEQRYGVVLSNFGATGAVVFATSPAKPGDRIYANVHANFNLTIDLPVGDTIAGLATSGQNFSADALGESLFLLCSTPNVWTRQSLNGTWSAT